MRKKLNALAGFTLAELLIVVAIIAVLVAISIPIFSSKLEASRESTDAANLRSAYAAAATALLTEKDDNGDPLGLTEDTHTVTCYYSKQGKLVVGTPTSNAMKGKSTIDDWQGSTIDDLPVGVFLQRVDAITDIDDLDVDAETKGNSEKGGICIILNDDPAEGEYEITVFFLKVAAAAAATPTPEG